MSEQKTVSQLLEELKQAATSRNAEMTTPLFIELMSTLGCQDPAEFARRIGMSWVSVDRWLNRKTCPRISNLEAIEAYLAEEQPINPQGLMLYAKDGFASRLSKARRVWTFIPPGVDASRLIGELMLNTETERYYVASTDSAGSFRSFRRKVEWGGLPGLGLSLDQLQGKIIGLLVQANDYPMFVTGVPIYLLEVESENDKSLEGYMALPIMNKPGKSRTAPAYVRIDQTLVQEWCEHCQFLTTWYEAHRTEKKIEELEVRYA